MEINKQYICAASLATQGMGCLLYGASQHVLKQCHNLARVIIIIVIVSILVSPKLYFCINRAQTLGAIAPCSLDFLTDVGRRLSAATGDARETAFLFHRISVALQRFSAVLIHKSFVAHDVEPDL